VPTGADLDLEIGSGAQKDRWTNPAPPDQATLLRVLVAALPPPGPFPLRQHQPEAGRFGPGSVSGEVCGSRS
jgi:hypothetical protein